jgi:hypothetical protein
VVNALAGLRAGRAGSGPDVVSRRAGWPCESPLAWAPRPSVEASVAPGQAAGDGTARQRACGERGEIVEEIRASPVRRTVKEAKPRNGPGRQVRFDHQMGPGH